MPTVLEILGWGLLLLIAAVLLMWVLRSDSRRAVAGPQAPGSESLKRAGTAEPSLSTGLRSPEVTPDPESEPSDRAPELAGVSDDGGVELADDTSAGEPVDNDFTASQFVEADRFEPEGFESEGFGPEGFGPEGLESAGSEDAPGVGSVPDEEITLADNAAPPAAAGDVHTEVDDPTTPDTAVFQTVAEEESDVDASAGAQTPSSDPSLEDRHGDPLGVAESESVHHGDVTASADETFARPTAGEDTSPVDSDTSPVDSVTSPVGEESVAAPDAEAPNFSSQTTATDIPAPAAEAPQSDRRVPSQDQRPPASAPKSAPTSAPIGLPVPAVAVATTSVSRWRRSPAQERRLAALSEAVFTTSRGTGTAYDDVRRYFARERYPLTTNRVREAAEDTPAMPTAPSAPRLSTTQPVPDSGGASSLNGHDGSSEGAPQATTGGLLLSERFPGGAEPLSDGSAPTGDFVIKGNARSMLFHSPKSRYFAITRAEVWFRSEEDAEAAGFRRFA